MPTCEYHENSFFESNHTGEAGVGRLRHADGLQCSQPLDLLFAVAGQICADAAERRASAS